MSFQVDMDMDDKHGRSIWTARPAWQPKVAVHGLTRCIRLLSVFCRPVRAPGLQRMEIAGVGRVPSRGANSIPIDNLQMHSKWQAVR